MPIPTSHPPRRSLLTQRDFMLIWSAGLALFTGSQAMFVVLPILIYQRTGSAWATAVTVLCWALPSVTVGQIAGVVADRVDRRRLLIGTTLLSATLTLLYPVLESGPWWHLALLAFVLSSVGQFHGPAEHALIPEVVPRQRLGEGASLNALNNNLGRLIGPAAGGALFAAAGLGTFAVAKAVLGLLATVLLVAVSTRRPFTPSRQGAPDRLASAWRAGIRIVWRHRRLRLIVVLLALTAFGEGFLSALVAPFVDEMLRGGADTLGVILSAQAIGGMAGAWWASRIADRTDPLLLLGACALVGAVLLGAVFNYAWLYPRVWPAIVLTAAMGIPFAIFGAAQVLALQRYAPPRLRGRVFSAAVGLMALAQLTGIVIAGVSGERWGPVMINVDAVAYLIAGVIALTVALRATRRRAG